MASSKDYLQFVLEQLSELQETLSGFAIIKINPEQQNRKGGFSCTF